MTSQAYPLFSGSFCAFYEVMLVLAVCGGGANFMGGIC